MVRCVRPMTHLPTPQCIGENAALLIDPTPRAEDETRATSAGRVVYSFRHPLVTLPGAQLKYDISTPLTSTIPHICACLLFPSCVLNFDLHVPFLQPSLFPKRKYATMAARSTTLSPTYSRARHVSNQTTIRISIMPNLRAYRIHERLPLLLPNGSVLRPHKR